MLKNLAWVFGVVFVLIGLLGFIPNPIVGAGGIFETNTPHDLVHLIIGLVFLYAVMKMPMQLSMVFKVVGVVYLAIAILGFLMVPDGGALLGLVQTNMNDHWLHVFLGVVIAGIGWMM